jgi:outer membrane protein assembly factor BamB
MPRAPFAHAARLATLSLTIGAASLVPLSALTMALTMSGCNKSAKTDGSSTTAPAATTQTASAAGGSTSAFPVVHEDWAKLGYRLDWVGFPFLNAARNARVIDILPLGDSVVAQESGSTVTLMVASNGENRWSTDLTGPLTKWVGMIPDATNPDRFIVSSESEAFVMTKANGNLAGREELSLVVNTAPIQQGSMLVYGTPTGRIIGHLMGVGGRGVTAWGFTSVGSIDADLTPLGTNFVSVSSGGDVLVMTTRGNLLGRARVFGPVDHPPATDGQSVFVASRDQSLWAFATTGGTLWRHRTSQPITARPVAHDGSVYVHLRDEGLTAFDASSGSVRWSNPNVKGTIIGVRSGSLLAWDGASLTTLDAARGDVISTIALPGVTKLVPDAFVDGNLYAASDKLVLARFSPR